LSAFPTPVSQLILRALPWTVGLLLVSTLLTWFLGNLLGGLAGYYRKSRVLKAFGVLSMGLHPIPYYVVAFVLLIIFGFLWPVLPISGGATMASDRSNTLAFALDVAVHSILPVLSLMAVGIGGWFMGMRSLVSNIVTEDYVVYAELAGVKRSKILQSYVMRNALGPQVTGLALQLGAIFNGAIITEQVFGYPGVGSLLISAVHAGDYSLVLGITTVSILAVSATVLLIDLLYPLIDPRVEAR
jgi:peptide/nickel transport system permease protein